MSILISQKILNRIHDELSHSKESFLLISAYCNFRWLSISIHVLPTLESKRS